METVSAVARLVAPLLSWASTQDERTEQSQSVAVPSGRPLRESQGGFAGQTVEVGAEAKDSSAVHALAVGKQARTRNCKPGTAGVFLSQRQPSRLRKADLLREFPAPITPSLCPAPSRLVRDFLGPKDLASLASVSTAWAAGNYLSRLDKTFGDQTLDETQRGVHSVMHVDAALAATALGVLPAADPSPGHSERAASGASESKIEHPPLDSEDKACASPGATKEHDRAAPGPTAGAGLVSPEEARRHAVAVCLARGQLRLALTALHLRSDAPMGMAPGREPDPRCHYPRLLQAARFDKEGPQAALEVLGAVKATGALATPELFLGVIEALITAPRFAVKHVPSVLADMAALGLGAPRALALALLQFEMAARLVSASARSKRGRTRAQMRRKRKQAHVGAGAGSSIVSDGTSACQGRELLGADGMSQSQSHGQSRGGRDRPTGARGRAGTVSTQGDTVRSALEFPNGNAGHVAGGQGSSNGTQDPYDGIDEAAMAWLVPTSAGAAAASSVGRSKARGTSRGAVGAKHGGTRDAPEFEAQTIAGMKQAAGQAAGSGELHGCGAQPSSGTIPPIPAPSLPGFTAAAVDLDAGTPASAMHPALPGFTASKLPAAPEHKQGEQGDSSSPRIEKGAPRAATDAAQSEAGQTRTSKGSGRRSRRLRSKAVSARRAALEWYGSRGRGLPGVVLPAVPCARGEEDQGGSRSKSASASSKPVAWVQAAPGPQPAAPSGEGSAGTGTRVQPGGASMPVIGLDAGGEDPEGSARALVPGHDAHEDRSAGCPSVARSVVTTQSATAATGPPLLPFPRRAIDFVTWARALTGCPLRRVGSLVANMQQQMDSAGKSTGKSGGKKERRSSERAHGSASVSAGKREPRCPQQCAAGNAGLQALPAQAPEPPDTKGLGSHSRQPVRAMQVPGFNAEPAAPMEGQPGGGVPLFGTGGQGRRPASGLSSMHASPARRSRAGTGDSNVSASTDAAGSGRSRKRKRRRRRRGPSDGETGLLGSASGIDGASSVQTGRTKSTTASSRVQAPGRFSPPSGGMQMPMMVGLQQPGGMLMHRTTQQPPMGFQAVPALPIASATAAPLQVSGPRSAGAHPDMRTVHHGVHHARALQPPLVMQGAGQQQYTSGIPGVVASQFPSPGAALARGAPARLGPVSGDGAAPSADTRSPASSLRIDSKPSTGLPVVSSGFRRSRQRGSRSALLGGDWSDGKDQSRATAASGGPSKGQKKKGGSTGSAAAVEEDMRSRFGLDLSFL